MSKRWFEVLDRKWVYEKKSMEFLNVETNAIIRSTHYLDDRSWIPAIEHEAGGVKRILWKGAPIKEREHAWYQTTEDERKAIDIAMSRLLSFMDEIKITGDEP